jgi:transmembrane protein 70, mitochondrial
VQVIQTNLIISSTGSLTKNIKSVKVFSLTTSFAGVLAQPMLYEQATKVGTSMPLVLTACTVVGFFTFITPILLHSVTKRYVTELYYDEKTKEYTAIIITFFLQKKEIKFKVEDVSVPEVPGMFTSFVVKSKGQEKPMGLFVDPKLFDDPTHYIKIMGYDKPIDFRFEEAQEGLKEKDTKK